MIGRSGKRESGISVLAAQQDDDDDDDDDLDKIFLGYTYINYYFDFTLGC